MKPLEIAAQFAAFTWYTQLRQAPSQITQAEAKRFSKQNWQIFVPAAHEGWGRLLLQIAKAPSGSQHKKPVLVSPRRKRPLAVAV
jgi:hypothetical protein